MLNEKTLILLKVKDCNRQTPKKKTVESHREVETTSLLECKDSKTMIILDQSSVCGSTAMLFERAVLNQSAAAVSYPACSQQQFKHYNYENTKKIASAL